MSTQPKALLDNSRPVLISFPICPFVQRSAIILKHKGQDFERINIDLSNKPQWFLDLAPTGKVPALVIDSQSQNKSQNQNKNKKNPSVIFESAIINEYLDEQYGQPLMPEGALEKAQDRAWISFSESLLFTQYALFCATDAKTCATLSETLFAELKKLTPERHGYYRGNKLSLIDAAYAPLFTRLAWLPELMTQLEDYASSCEPGKNLWAWINNLSQLPAVIDSVDENFSENFERYFHAKGSAVVKSGRQAA